MYFKKLLGSYFFILILGLFVSVFSLIPSQTFAIGGWVEQTSVGKHRWYSITSSDDGLKLAAVDNNNGYIYTSTDSGANWTTNEDSSGQHYWQSISSSSNGNKLVAADSGDSGNGYIYTSTNSGLTWTTNIGIGSAGQHQWYSVSSNSTGDKLAAVDNNTGYIYTSTDSGATWTTNIGIGSAGQHQWRSITSSDDGLKLAAVDNFNGYIYTSTDSGATWTTNGDSSGQHYWYSITSDSTGDKLAATIYGEVNPGSGIVVRDYIYISTNGGLSWTQTNAPQSCWYSIASDSTGEKLAAVDACGDDFSGGYIYVSTDSGGTWALQTSAGKRAWGGISSSTDGNKLAAVDIWGSDWTGGYIYTYSPTSDITAYNTALSSVNEEDYTIATWTIYQGIIDENVVTDQDPQEDIDIATANIIEAQTDLMEVSDITTYTEAINAVDQENYTVASWTTYQSIVNAHIVTNQNTQAQVNAATLTINNAQNNLVGLGFPILTTITASSITTDTVKLNGTISNIGGGSIITRGFEYGLTTGYGVTTTENGTFGKGIFFKNISGLACGNTYHYRAYAINTSKTGYGGDITFNTAACPSYGWVKRINSNQHNWSSIDSSADGSKLVASVNDGYIYTSTDGGATWTERTGSGSRIWSSVTSSDDGVKLAATVSYGYIYTSNDGGTTWVERTNLQSRYWKSIDSSSDGTKLVAVVGAGGYIYKSDDSGATWVATNSTVKAWENIASSSDGMNLIAVSSYYIYISSDRGDTWTEITSTGSHAWNSVASSGNGMKLVATGNAESNSYIYTSNDGGTTWIERTNAGLERWNSVTSSADGSKIAAVNYLGYLYISTDSGVNWIPQVNAGQYQWKEITSSSNGNKLAAIQTVWNEYVYTYIAPQAPTTTTKEFTENNNNELLNGSIVSTGEEDPSIRGFEYGLTTDYGKTISESGLFGIGDFSKPISSLDVSCGVVNHYRAYTINSGGTGYGSDMIFEKSNCENIIGRSAESLAQFKLEQTKISNTKISNTQKPSINLIKITTKKDSNTSVPIGSNIVSNLTRTLKQKMIGSDVKLVQQYLNLNGYILSKEGPGSLNNETTYFGDKTKSAVTSFQKDHNLVPDGIIGPKTKGVMN